VDRKYPTATSILGKLISMILAEHGDVQSARETSRLFTCIRRAGITPDMSDEEIEAELFRLIDSGQFGPDEADGAGAPRAAPAVADAPWQEEVREELERTGAVFEQRWELSNEVLTRRALTFEPTDAEGVLTVMAVKSREQLFQVRLEDVLPALRTLPGGVGTHAVIAELRKRSI
jgi:hypothetical protein